MKDSSSNKKNQTEMKDSSSNKKNQTEMKDSSSNKLCQIDKGTKGSPSKPSRFVGGHSLAGSDIVKVASF